MSAKNGIQIYPEQAKVAIYWDFENLHAVLVDQDRGSGSYRENPYTVQPAIVRMAPILDYAASFGDVIINRAYANWQWFHRYRDDLNGAGIDLIQLFPRGANMKNSADIRMALDALSDIHIHPHITHVVVVSSDSDFISLAQKVKQAGKFIAGVGITGISNKFWVASCNEFKFYEGLLALSESIVEQTHDGTPETSREEVPATIPPLDEAREALVKAMTQLVAKDGENYVERGVLKKVIKRLMPSFDEGILGCANFSDFLSQFPQLIRVVDTTGGGHVALVKPPKKKSIKPATDSKSKVGAPSKDKALAPNDVIPPLPSV